MRMEIQKIIQPNMRYLHLPLYYPLLQSRLASDQDLSHPNLCVLMAPKDARGLPLKIIQNNNVIAWGTYYLGTMGWISFSKIILTDKPLPETLIFASTNPQYDYSLNYKFITWKFQAQIWGEHVVYRTIFVHNMFSPMFCKKKSFWKRFACILMPLHFHEIYNG